jgi:hypothetical protein
MVGPDSAAQAESCGDGAWSSGCDVEASFAQAVALAFSVIVVAWWTSRSIRAAATIAAPRISPHCSEPRLPVTIIDPRS